MLEKAMAHHSSTLVWKIPWAEEPGRLPSMGSRRVKHDWATSLSLFTFMHWRRKWPVFLPGESQERGSLVGCCLWGHRVRHDWSDLAAARPTCLHIPGCLALCEWSHHHDYLDHEDLFLYSYSVYSCHLFLISSASVRSIPFLSGPYYFCPLLSPSLHEMFPWYL